MRGLCRGGGDERRWEALIWKEDTGRSASSSSERSGDRGSSATVEPSETNERLGTWGNEKFRLLRYAGDDSASLCELFHEEAWALEGLTLVRAWMLETGRL